MGDGSGDGSAAALLLARPLRVNVFVLWWAVGLPWVSKDHDVAVQVVVYVDLLRSVSGKVGMQDGDSVHSRGRNSGTTGELDRVHGVAGGRTKTLLYTNG